MTLIGKKLAISEITPSLDFSSPETQETWKKTISHAKRQSLRDIIAIRSTVQDSITQTLRKREFLHPPVHLFAPCVDPLNHETESPEITYYGQTCSLMQSLIFHKMALLALTDIQDVFWISPNVRKELNVSDKKRYASEFTQIDFESSKLDMESCMQLIGLASEICSVGGKTDGDLTAVPPQNGRCHQEITRLQCFRT